jgi:hypothetical protein
VADDGLRKLIQDLGQASKDVIDQGAKVVSKGALNIRRDWRGRWTGYPHIKMLPYAISYDTRRHVADITAEIGPDKDKPQGPLGNLIEFGSVNNAPIPGGIPALDAEDPRFAQAVANLGQSLLQGDAKTEDAPASG